MTEPARSLDVRLADTRRRLADDVDCWVASAGREVGEVGGVGGAGEDVVPYLVPLSFWYDGTDLWLATGSTSPTVRNLLAAGRTRLALGLVRDVVMIDATVRGVAAGEVDTVVGVAVGEAFAAKSGFDPRGLTGPYTYLRCTPVRIQAWREENELARRDLMRDGRWLA